MLQLSLWAPHSTRSLWPCIPAHVSSLPIGFQVDCTGQGKTNAVSPFMFSCLGDGQQKHPTPIALERGRAVALWGFCVFG